MCQLCTEITYKRVTALLREHSNETKLSNEPYCDVAAGILREGVYAWGRSHIFDTLASLPAILREYVCPSEEWPRVHAVAVRWSRAQLAARNGMCGFSSITFHPRASPTTARSL
jgi:hypothetical protein